MRHRVTHEWVEVEGDVPKVEPTQRFFTELRASLKNALEVERDLRILCEADRAALDALACEPAMLERLRDAEARAVRAEEAIAVLGSDCRDAQGEVEVLEGELVLERNLRVRAEEALRPFAGLYDGEWPENTPGNVAHLKAIVANARAALAAAGADTP
jgi:hypothetical protein